MLFKRVLALVSAATASFLKATTLDSLRPGTWLEDIAIRPNGDILVTQFAPTPGIFTIREPWLPNSTLQKILGTHDVHNISNIVQLNDYWGEEKYLFIGGDAAGLGAFCIGSYSAWILTLGRTGKKVERVSDLGPDTYGLAGLATIPSDPYIVLIADSHAGSVGRLDIDTGVYDSVALLVPEMAPPYDPNIRAGVNGIQVRYGHLYFSNSKARSIYRVPITPDGRQAEILSKAKLVADLSGTTSFVDDFVFDRNGNIYAAADGSIVFVNVKTGKSRVVLESREGIVGATSVAWGRGEMDENTLYFTTSGGMGDPSEGGAKVAAIRQCHV